MSERTQQDRRNSVSMAEYLASLAWRVPAEELAEPSEEGERNRFILRLLDPDLHGAYDRLVEVFAVDGLGDEGDSGVDPLVSVRPIIEEGQTGAAESYSVDSGGVIIEEGEERGYFVDGNGIDLDELNASYALMLRKPLKVPEIKYAELPLPE